MCCLDYGVRLMSVMEHICVTVTTPISGIETRKIMQGRNNYSISSSKAISYYFVCQQELFMGKSLDAMIRP